jgi:hypothetical protein
MQDIDVLNGTRTVWVSLHSLQPDKTLTNKLSSIITRQHWAQA